MEFLVPPCPALLDEPAFRLHFQTSVLVTLEEMKVGKGGRMERVKGWRRNYIDFGDVRETSSMNSKSEREFFFS